MKRREIITLTLDATALFLIYQFLALSFTERQKTYIRERDGKCMLPIPHPCNFDKKTPQVHHIKPGRVLRSRGIDDEYIDVAENAITLCEYAHQRIIHKDMIKALEAYRKGDKQAFDKVFEQRDDMIKKGQEYWDTRFDLVFTIKALYNTQEAKKSGRFFPQKKTR